MILLSSSKNISAPKGDKLFPIPSGGALAFDQPIFELPEKMVELPFPRLPFQITLIPLRRLASNEF